MSRNYGIVLPNWLVDGEPERLVEYAVAAETAGWDGVLLADHLVFPPSTPDDPVDAHGAFPDPWVTMAAIAAETDRIRLGSWVTPVARRQPWQLARDLATLDRLSDGRVVLGTGLGRSSDYTTFGEAWNPRRIGERYDEALDVLAGLWRGEPFSYDGDHYTVDDAVVLPTPVQEPRIPVIVGGMWPNKKPFHRGASWDGIVPHYPGDGVVPAEGIDGLAEGTDDPVEAADEMLAYYHDIADDPGEVFMPADPPHDTARLDALCEEYDVSWRYTRPIDDGEWNLSMDRVRAGPPE